MSPDSSQTPAAEMSRSPRGSGPDPPDVARQPDAPDARGTDEPNVPGGASESSEDLAGTAVYRTASGWRVGEEELPDLVNAMALADLLAGERTLPASPPVAGTAADGPETGDPDTAKLKLTVAQLEHALANRVRVEQAIGTLAERHRLPPRRAFELLRGAARSRGRRVHDLAGEVVQSVTNPLLPLPEELARPPKVQRSRRPRPV
jgi:hypothetical protein